MGLQYILQDRSKLGCDWQLGIGHQYRMYLGKGRHIFGWHKLGLGDIQRYLRIQVCKMVDFLYNQVHMNKQLGC